ncbi:helix-turn-helix domain-containing protein [Streptomyces sp. NBC_01716]|uniref:helix-turn-helix domain-containing protein n=1 Tax=Streptomyces sp. NBC_01716 TaxID=2975917 RepID=UPI002E2FA86E|nr:helix-turn-helix transcriptional regulator [Streptomyces sp. NBC_01716]
MGEVRATPGSRAEDAHLGEVIRTERGKQRMTIAQLAAKMGYSIAQVSRYETGRSSLADVATRRLFIDALGLPPQALGLAPDVPVDDHGRAPDVFAEYPRLPASMVRNLGSEDGEDAVRRRKLLANLAVTAAAAAGTPLMLGSTGNRDTLIGDVLVGRLRDAMLGLGGEVLPEPVQLSVELGRAVADFHACRYDSLSSRLPLVIRSGHAHSVSGNGQHLVLAKAYVLATRLLVKFDEQQLGWMAADRARQLAEADGNTLAIAESARQIAVLARRAGWHHEAMSIALTAAGTPGLREAGHDGTAQRGLLIQSAAYSAARDGDADAMREMTAEAAAIARELGSTTRLRDHGGGFSAAMVQLHLISAENSTGDPGAALTAARAMTPQSLPTVERRARYFTDVAAALGRWGRRDECVRALLAAEQHAPEETHSRPAVKTMVSGLLVSGRTTSELRGLAARCGVLV